MKRFFSVPTAKRLCGARRATMMLLAVMMLTLTAQTAWAAEWPKYITDVILVGGTDSEVTTAKNNHSDYTFINVNLNSDAGGDKIYLGYKKSYSANTNGGYITALYLTTKSAGDCSQTLTFGGVEYTRTPCYGGTHFVNDVKGDLNSDAGGEDIHLYYTKKNFDNKRVISDISLWAGEDKDHSTPSGYTKLGFDGKTEEFDLNDDAGGDYVYLYYQSATKVNRPNPEPSMASNLVYTGSPQKLISSTYSNSNTGTLYYRVGTSGSYTSTVNDVTATNAGTYTFYYYSGSNSYGNSSVDYAHSKTVTIAKAQNSGVTVTCDDVLESVGPSPSITGTNLSSGAITYTYATSQGGTYTSTVPSSEGTYWVKATIASDDNYKEYTTQAASFKLKRDWEVHNSGESEADAYVIKTTDDLDLLAERVNADNTYIDRYFILDADLTYDGTMNNFTTIGMTTGVNTRHPFLGNFNGNGKTISGIWIEQQGSSNIGLFGYARMGATIKNLTLANSKIKGTVHVGGIVGECKDVATIANCIVTSNVTINNDARYTGGIAGSTEGNVIGCISAANVNGTQYVGGIIGDGYINNEFSSNITNCLYTGTSIFGWSNVGAISGTDNGTFSNNYYTADLTCGGCDGSDTNGARKAVAINAADGVTVTPTGDVTAYNVSGITAYADNSGMSYGGNWFAGATESVKTNIAYTVPEGYVLNGYTDGNGNALTKNNDGSYSLTMTDAAATVTPDVTDLWGINAGRDGSTAEKAYLITTTAGLDLLAKSVNGTDGYSPNNYNGKFFELGANIDYSQVALTLDDGKSNYTAIGTNSNNFSGKFDGKGHTISGIVINKNANNQGIFGYIYDGEVKNLTIDDASINIGSGNENAGGIAGSTNNGTIIENCHVTSNVTISGNYNVGGIAGSLFIGPYITAVTGCTSAAAVSVNSQFVGGIVGDNNQCTIQDCLYLGNSVTSGVNSHVGAIVGYNRGTLTNNYHTCSGMGGVGSVGDATGSDVADAQFAISSATAPDEATIGTAGTAYAADETYEGITPYTHGLYYNGRYYWHEELTTIELADQSEENDDVIVSNDSQRRNVRLSGRTLKKDGKWQTICLPFDVDMTDPACPLYGATYRTVTDTPENNENAISGTTLNFTFGEKQYEDDVDNTLMAGMPYLIRWDRPDDYEGNESMYDIVNPLFIGVKITYDNYDFWNDGGVVGFVGDYNCMKDVVQSYPEQYDVLLLGDDNNLHYATPGESLGACRAFFIIDREQIGDLDFRLTDYVFDLGNGEMLSGTFFQPFVPGDVNKDGKVTPADAIMILYAYFGVEQQEFNRAAADLNGDGFITPADAIEALYRYFGAGSGNSNARSLRPTTNGGQEPE